MYVCIAYYRYPSTSYVHNQVTVVSTLSIVVFELNATIARLSPRVRISGCIEMLTLVASWHPFIGRHFTVWLDAAM